jgi:YVTN family beta-propeller protein
MKRRVSRGRRASPYRSLERALLLSTALTGALAMFAPDVACAQAGLLLYVPNALSNNLSAYSTAANGTLTSTTTIAAGSSPASAAVRGDQAFAYVTIPDNNSVSVIDTVSQTIVQTVATGACPYGVAVGPDGLTVYVANHNADTVSVYAADPLTGQLTPTTTISTGVSPRSLAVSPDGTRLYVVNQFGDTLGIYNTATNALITNVAVGSQPLSVATQSRGDSALRHQLRQPNRVGDQHGDRHRGGDGVAACHDPPRDRRQPGREHGLYRR